MLMLRRGQQRNKPTEPPKIPEKAPFFLSSVLDRAKPDHSSTTKNVQGNVNDQDGRETKQQRIDRAENSRILKSMGPRAGGGAGSERSFTVLLHEGARSGNCTSSIRLPSICNIILLFLPLPLSLQPKARYSVIMG